MKFTVNLNKDDYKAFRRYCLNKYQHMPWMFLIIVGFLEFMTWRGHKPGTSLSFKIGNAASILIIFFAFLGAFMVIRWIIVKLTRSSFQHPYGQHEYEITDSVLRERNELGMIETNRSRIKHVAQTKDHVFVILSNGLGHIIPKRELAPELLRDVLNQLDVKTQPTSEGGNFLNVS
jgi:hypothetical protein